MQEIEQVLTNVAAEQEALRNALPNIAAAVAGMGILGFAIFTIRDIFKKTR